MAPAKNTFTFPAEVRGESEGTGLQSGSSVSLNQMHFETKENECELFLAAEGVGFLMLSADGEMLRKWQGLTIAETSVCAGLRWEFGHAEHIQRLKRKHWISTQRDSVSITRDWHADCGCKLQERWDWSEPATGLLVTLKVKTDENQSCGQNEVCIRATPLWTLAHSGDFHCGTQATHVICDPKQPETLHLNSPDFTAQIEVSCSKQLSNEQVPEPGEWQAFPTAVREWLPTPKDAQRGEQSAREILTNHFFQLCTQKDGEAHILFKSPKVTLQSRNQANHFSRVSPSSEMTCSHQKLATAFRNSAESLNQLVQIRSDGTQGLQAGLPWFTQFWTRDMCHSFRAAFLWSGRNAMGEALLSDLWLSSRAGSIPNYTTVQATANNSVDALPLLLLSTADFIEHCGWSASLEKC